MTSATMRAAFAWRRFQDPYEQQRSQPSDWNKLAHEPLARHGDVPARAAALLSPRTYPHRDRAPDFEDEATVIEDRPRAVVLKLVT